MLNQGIQISLILSFLIGTFGWVDPALGMGRAAHRHLMVSLGDSMTAATFADTSTNMPVSFFQSLRGGLALDSFKTLVLIENKKSYSWSSGQWIDSHYNKLVRAMEYRGFQGDLDVMNVAVPGSVAEDTLKQAQKIVDVMNSGEYEKLEYVTLLIGANDACTSESPVGTPHEVFRRHVRATLSKLAEIQQGESVRVLVSSIPNIPALGDPKIRDHRTMGVMSCDYFRHEVLKFCRPLTRWSDERDFLQKYQSVVDKNEILREEVEEAMRSYPQLDLVYSDSLHQFEITPEILAADCFHPNQQGQEILSNLLWKDQPWY